MCAAIPKDSSVVFVDGFTADRLTEIVRGMCGDPAARVTPVHTSTQVTAVRDVVRDIQRAGRRPVLLAADTSELKPYGGVVRKVMTLSTRMDNSTLMFPPRTTLPENLDVSMWEPAP